MKGTRIAILGAMRSGVAAARAALRRGALPTVFDAKAADDPTFVAAAEALGALGVPVIPDLRGAIPPGFDLLVTSPGVRRDSPTLQAAVRAGVEVVGEIEFAYRLSRPVIAAITGTNGKSTTTAMLWHILHSAGRDAVLCGNIFGSGYDEATLTEAADAYQPGQVLVAEISSFQLEWVSQWHPRVATVTNVTDDHLNRHATFEEYRAAKHRIFTNMGAGDIAVAHSGDPMVVPPAGVPVEWFGNDGDPSFVADAQWTLLGSTVAVSQLSTPEPHNLLNAQTAALMAVRVSEMVGRPIAPSEAQAALTSFRPLAHRMEVVGERKGVLLVNNSMCTNPAAVVASSQGMARRQHLLVGGAAKTSDFSPLAEYLREQPHQVYLFGQDAPLIRERLQGGWPVYSDIAEAFRAAVDAARSGEAVILSPGCASFDRFEGFWARGDLFKTLAKEWLER